MAPSGLQRAAQNAAVPVMDHLLEDRFGGDDAIAGDFDLLRLQQKYGGGIQEKLRAVVGCGHTDGAGKSQNQNAAVERPAPPGEFLAADFDRLLAAQVAPLVLRDEFGTIGVRLRAGRVSMDSLYAFPTTSSFSKFTPKLFCTPSTTS